MDDGLFSGGHPFFFPPFFFFPLGGAANNRAPERRSLLFLSYVGIDVGRLLLFFFLPLQGARRLVRIRSSSFSFWNGPPGVGRQWSTWGVPPFFFFSLGRTGRIEQKEPTRASPLAGWSPKKGIGDWIFSFFFPPFCHGQEMWSGCLLFFLRITGTLRGPFFFSHPALRLDGGGSHSPSPLLETGRTRRHFLSFLFCRSRSRLNEGPPGGGPFSSYPLYCAWSGTRRPHPPLLRRNGEIFSPSLSEKM